MKKSRISIIVGTRPQIIKSQPMINQLKESFSVEVINTGQHYDYELSQKIFADLKIPKPTKSLGIGSGTQLQQIAKIVTNLEKYFEKNSPDLVIVPGDTTSALASAIAASKCKITLAHLEAGARSNQFSMNEEINRRIVDHCSNILFAPTQCCLRNLKDESVFGKSYFVGDTMFDLFLYYKEKMGLKKIKPTKNSVLITIHRAENILKKSVLKNICNMVNGFEKEGYSIVFPLHPHTKKMLKKHNLKLNVKPHKPLGYVEMLENLAKSSLIITDSGGLQKESFWMERPCITLRENTEWVETVNEGANIVINPAKPIPMKKIKKMQEKRIKLKSKLFGSGNASKNISKIISEHLK